MKNNVLTKAAIALSAAALLAVPTLASAAATAPQAPYTPHAQQGQQRVPRGPLTVSYYAGDPAQGGKLLKTLTLQPPTRDGKAPEGQGGFAGKAPNAQLPKGNPEGQGPDAKNAHQDGKGHGHHGHHGFGNLKAQAPTGATFAVIKDDKGQSRTIDLSKAPKASQNKAN